MDGDAKSLPLVSVVILNYDGGKYIEKCLESVLNTKYPNFEVIFIDNASIDGSFELVEDLFSTSVHLKMIRNSENLGFAKGNNIGFKYTKGNYVIFLNNDTRVSQKWLQELVRIMESDLTIGAAQSKLVQMHDPKRIDTAGQPIDFLGYGYPTAGEEDIGQYNHSTKEIFYADGAAIIIRRNAISASSLEGVPFDHDYFCYYEETDLCWRMRLHGYRIVFVPSSIVYHARGTTHLSKMPQHLIFHHSKNRIMTLLKNYSLKNLPRYLLPLLVLEVARSIVLAKKNIPHSLAILSGILWNIKNLRKTWRKRLIVQRFIRSVPDSYVMRLMRRPNLVHLYHRFRGLSTTLA